MNMYPDSLYIGKDGQLIVWSWLGGDLEAKYDGSLYVDIRHRGTGKRILFISHNAAENLLALFPKDALATSPDAAGFELQY